MQINNALINILLYYFSDLYPEQKKNNNNTGFN